MDVSCILMMSCTNEFYSDITHSGIHAFKMLNEIFLLRELRECIVDIELISVKIAGIIYKEWVPSVLNAATKRLPISSAC